MGGIKAASSPWVFSDFKKETSDNFQMCVFEEGCGSVKETQADNVAEQRGGLGSRSGKDRSPAGRTLCGGLGATTITALFDIIRESASGHSH